LFAEPVDEVVFLVQKILLACTLCGLTDVTDGLRRAAFFCGAVTLFGVWPQASEAVA
jgi:hypothetical protein